MKTTFNEQDDALCVRLGQTPVVESEEVKPQVTPDYDNKDRVVRAKPLGVVHGIDLAELRCMHPDVA